MDRSVIVTVVAMRMVQVTVDEIVNVITVGYRLVSTPGAMYMIGGVATTGVRRCACIGIHVADFHHMLLDLAVLTDVMQVAVVEIVDMVAMLDAGVLAVRAVGVIMMLV